MGKSDIQPIQSFKETMRDTALSSFEDIAEIGLDSLLEDGFLKELPVVGMLFRMGKGISSIKDAVLAKRMLVFAQQVQTNSVSDEELQQHIEKLSNNSGKFGKELETILDYIAKQTGYIKAKILGNFYCSFLRGEIEWDDLILLADITDDIYLTDIETLLDLCSKREYLPGAHFDMNCAKRLDRCSLIDYFNGMIASSSQNPGKGIQARINNLGDAFVEIGLKNIDISKGIKI